MKSSLLLLFSFLMFFSSAGFANPQLSLLTDNEWASDCRQFVKASGKKMPKALAAQRTLSTYQLKDQNLIWSVKSFKDPQCSELFNVNRYTLHCSFDEKSDFAKCKQTKVENSKDGRTWVEDKPVEQAGHSISMELKVKAKALLKNKSIELTTVSASKGPEKEILKPTQASLKKVEE